MGGAGYRRGWSIRGSIPSHCSNRPLPSRSLRTRRQRYRFSIWSAISIASANSQTEIWEGPIRYLVNDLWTSGQRQAHSIHEVSYRACFKPQLPEFFIERLTVPGDAIYDPFMGRGTTPIQAALIGRQPVGNDINPLSILLTRPRLNPPTLNAVASRLKQIKWDLEEIEEPELLAFYSPGTLRQVCALRRWLIEHAPPDGTSNSVDDWIRMVAVNRLTGHSPSASSPFTHFRPIRQSRPRLSARSMSGEFRRLLIAT